MKSTFERYPEVLLADSTYKTNNLNMALYAILAVGGLGESHVVASFFVTTEDKTTLEDMLQRFRTRNPRWGDIATVITDKDMTERSVFKSIFPQVDLQNCLYHTLRIFSREVTMDKMSVNSADRKLSLEFLEKLAYAQDNTEYQETYRSFCNEVPASVSRYFTANWHPIRVEWVKGLKSIHLQNNTTNRVESFFSKLKAYFSPRSELKETVSGLMNCIDSLRSERSFRQMKQITRIKVKDLSLSHLESQYQKLLTAHAFEAVHNEIRRQGNASRMTTEEDKCDCTFYRCMKLPCRHIFKLLNDRGQDMYVPHLVAARWTQQYNSILNVAYRQGTVTASVGTPVKERAVLTSNQTFTKGSVKLQKLVVMSNSGMDSFTQKMAFIDELL